MNRRTCFFLFAFAVFFAQTAPIPCQLPAVEPEKALFLMRSGQVAAAVRLYQERKAALGKHDLALVQEMSLALLHSGLRSNNPEIQFLTLFGAGISGTDRAIPLLEEALSSDNPQFQLVAIHLLAKLQNDNATRLLNHAMSSNFLLIRLEAVYCLAKNHDKKALGQIEALMQKVPAEILPLFPHLYALCQDNSSLKWLQKLLTHPQVEVRTEAALAAAANGRDDLLGEIRQLLSHTHPLEKETAAFALGIFKDEASVKNLEKQSLANDPFTRLSALAALYQLERREAAENIRQLAAKENVFAIYMLGSIAGSEGILTTLLSSRNTQTRLNASLALLKLKNKECLNGILPILIKDQKDLAIEQQLSPGKTLTAFKAVPSSSQNYAENPAKHEASLRVREEILAKTAELPQECFLKVAKEILEHDQNDLVPKTTELLANLSTPESTQLLQSYREKVGSPFVRGYCNLALFRAREKGPFAEEVKAWIAANQSLCLIELQQLAPLNTNYSVAASYQLTPRDASRLLVDSLEAIAQSQEEIAIDILLEAIASGNMKNRYALAGLLMRAAQ